MKLRTFKEEDSFHKREIIEEISTGLKRRIKLWERRMNNG